MNKEIKPIEVSEPVNVECFYTCPECLMAINRYDSYCPGCGKKINWKTPEEQPEKSCDNVKSDKPDCFSCKDYEYKEDPFAFTDCNTCDDFCNWQPKQPILLPPCNSCTHDVENIMSSQCYDCKELEKLIKEKK